MSPFTLPTIFLLYFLIQNLLFLPLFLSFDHVMAYTVTDQSFGSSHKLISANLIFPLLFHCMLLLTSLWTTDTFLDILFLGDYQMTEYGTNFLNVPWLHSTHNCIVQIILFLCNFLALFHFSSSYFVLKVKNPPQQPQKPDLLQPFALSVVCLLLSLIKGLRYWQIWSFLASV